VEELGVLDEESPRRMWPRDGVAAQLMKARGDEIASKRHAEDQISRYCADPIRPAGRRAGGSHWWGVAALVLLMPGCRESRQEDGAYPILGEPVVALTEELRIDGYARDLVPISWIAVSEEGTIAMIQRQDRSIRFFSPLGKSLGTFGRRGEGPGDTPCQGETCCDGRGLDRRSGSPPDVPPAPRALDWGGWLILDSNASARGPEAILRPGTWR
jgi:hypothetical protein